MFLENDEMYGWLILWEKKEKARKLEKKSELMKIKKMNEK